MYRMECAVCICDFNGGELVRSLPCTHRFHVSCIDHWLADRTTCPVCRVDLKVTASDPLHLYEDMMGDSSKERSTSDAVAAERSVAGGAVGDVESQEKPPEARSATELKQGIIVAASRECTVCLCDFREGELLRYLLPCEHRFHVSCIDHWLADKTTCPVCRVDLEVTASGVTKESGTINEVEGSGAV
ncbi:unnamed protein product [Closterium sp. Yama58-4]|nr:unnamed protein product [Closterium sp. Yama58-4]